MSSFGWIAAAAALSAAVALAGCTGESPSPAPSDGSGPDAPASQPETGATGAGSLPAGVMLAEAPDAVRPLGEVRPGAQPGDTVVFTARVGGREEPFVENRAMMLVVDPTLESCAELHGDACETPWDYCCEEPDSLLANTASVQFVGEDGKPLPFTLEGVDGIAPLATASGLSPIELRLEPFQERLLEEIEVARSRGQHNNLLVSATGGGDERLLAAAWAMEAVVHGD